MSKIKLEAEPTFKAKVNIPIPGGDPAPVEFTFKHRTRDAVLAWMDEIKGEKDSDAILTMASGWELDDEFNAKNIDLLCQNYLGAGKAIFETYLSELRGQRAKN